MPRSKSIWDLGAAFMNCIQARDKATAQKLLDDILHRINLECRGRHSEFKLRTLQILTNANRAAYNAGAAPEALAKHSYSIIEKFDRSISKLEITRYAHMAVDTSIELVPERHSYQERKIREAIDYIENHIAEPINRDQLAARIQCSPSHFSRLFSKVTGQTYRSFIQKSRLDKAKELLTQTSLNVSEISEEIGYQDPFQFSKTFRRHIGISPKQYRKTYPRETKLAASMF